MKNALLPKLVQTMFLGGTMTKHTIRCPKCQYDVPFEIIYEVRYTSEEME